MKKSARTFRTIQYIRNTEENQRLYILLFRYIHVYPPDISMTIQITRACVVHINALINKFHLKLVHVHSQASLFAGIKMIPYHSSVHLRLNISCLRNNHMSIGFCSLINDNRFHLVQSLSSF